MVFIPAMERWTSSTTSTGSSRVQGSLPNQSTCLLWKAFDDVPQGTLWAVLQEYGLYADHVILLASSSRDIDLLPVQFAARCEAVEMRISTYKFETMFLRRKTVEYPLHTVNNILLQV